MIGSVRLPFTSRPQSRWERVRESVPDREALLQRIMELERLRESVPYTSELRQRVQPLVQRAAAAREEFSMPEVAAFFQEHIPGLRRPRSRTQRLLNGGVPLWLLLAGALGGVLLGITLGAASARRRAGSAVDLEASAEQIKGAWPSIQDDDIRDAKGNIKKLTNVIRERTGEDTREVRERLQSLTASAATTNGGHAHAAGH